MTSEIRVNKLTNRIGLSTVTFADSGIGVTVTGRIDPDTDSARDLGTTSVRWRNVYADTLYGDGSNLTGISGVTINNNTNNNLVTATGTTGTLNGEANLTFDGSVLTNTGSTLIGNDIKSSNDDFYVYSYKGGSDGQVRSGIQYDGNSQRLRLFTGTNERLRITSDGKVSISNDGTADGLLTIKGNSDATTTPSIRLLDGSDTREVSITNTSGDFIASVHGNDNAIHGHIKMFESGIFTVATGGASGSLIERLRIDSNGESHFKQKLKVDYQVSGSDYCAHFRNQNPNSYGVWIQQPNPVNVGYPLLAVTNAAGQPHFRVDSGGKVYANSGTGTNHPAYFVRAWAQGSGSGSANGSGGLSSVSRPSTGRFLLTFATTMPDTNYAIGCLGNNNYSDTSWHNNEGTDNVSVYFYSNGSYQNPSKWSAWVMR